MPVKHLNSIDLYYESAGAGEPVLFIHGLGSSTRDWEAQSGYFAENFQVITFDVRGHGRSAKPAGPYSISLFAGDTAALIRSLAVGPVHLAGISMGGMIALQVTVDAPELVKTLTVVNSVPELILRTAGDRLRFRQRQLISKVLGMRAMGRFLARRLFPKPNHAAIRRLFADRWAENDRRAYLDALKALIGWSVTDQIAAIRCPVLFIAADHDYTPLSLKQKYVRQIPHAELVVINDSRHATPVEQPEAFNRALAAFLHRHRG